MVDALAEIHRFLAPGGTLVDARPDSRVLAYADRRKPRGFQRFGVVKTNRLELANDRASDRAVARVVREGLFESKRRGRFWHLVPFGTRFSKRGGVRETFRPELSSPGKYGNAVAEVPTRSGRARTDPKRRTRREVPERR